MLAGAAGFLALALAVIALPSVPGDVAAREWLLGAASPAAVTALRVINYAGSWRVLFPATLLLLLAFPLARRRWWVWVGQMLAAPGAEGLLKILIGRARPEEASMGFPSGHATAAAAFFGAVIYLARDLPSAPRALVRARLGSSSPSPVTRGSTGSPSRVPSRDHESRAQVRRRAC